MKLSFHPFNSFITTVVFIFLLSNLGSASEKKGKYIIVEKDNLKGLIDENGNTVIPIKYNDLGWSEGKPEPVNNVIGYKEDKNLWGLITVNNEILTPPQYSILSPADNGYIIAARKGKFTKLNFFGVMDMKGKNIIPYHYNSIEFAGDHLIASFKDQNRYKYGLINLENVIRIPFKYKKLSLTAGNGFAVKDFNNKYSLFDHSGKQITEFRFDSLASFKNGYMLVFENGKKGLINPEGKIIAPPEYAEIIIDNNKIKALPFNEWVILNSDNEVLIKFYYSTLRPITTDCFKVSTNNYEWLINTSGDMITSPDISKIYEFYDDIAVFKKNKKYGLLNDKGNIILNPEFDSLLFSDGFAYGNKQRSGKNSWAVYDTFGIKKSKNEYEEIRFYDSNLFAVKRRGKWGFMNRSGEEVVNCVFDHVGKFKRDKVHVIFHDEHGIINKESEWIIQPEKSEIELINEDFYLRRDYQESLKNMDGDLIYFTENTLVNKGYYLVEKKGDSVLWHIDLNGRMVDTVYQQVNENNLSDEDINIVKRNGKLGAVSSSGKILIGFNNNYMELHAPSEGYFGIKLDGAYGFVDYQNRLRVANRYEDIQSYSEGLAAVKIMNKWGFIDHAEILRIQPVYDKVNNFKNGFSIVGRNGKYGIINKKGELVQSFNFDKIQSRTDGFFTTYISDKTGLLDPQGRQIIHAKYDMIKKVKEGKLIISRNGKYGLLTPTGVSTIPLIYDKLIYDPYNDVFLGKRKKDWIELE